MRLNWNFLKNKNW